MKTLYKSLLVSSFLFSFPMFIGVWGGTLFAQTAPVQVVQDSLQAILDKATNGGSVIGVYNRCENWKWNGKSGVQDTSLTTTPVANAKFRIGSISKMFVAVAILKLVEQNMLSLDDSIGKWLPASIVDSIKYFRNNIAVRKLLAHTSGLNDYTGNPVLSVDSLCCSGKSFIPEELMLMGIDQYNHPDSNIFLYCNRGYVMLSQILKSVTGKSYQQVITDEIITPLGLANTFAPTIDTIPGAHMKCYGYDSKGVLHDMTNVSITWAIGAGDIVSNTDDLIKFYTALRDTQLINALSMNEMFTPVGNIINPQPMTAYGLGFTQFTNNFLGHGGKINNTSALIWFQDIDVYFSFNINTEKNAYWLVTDLMNPLYNYLKSMATPSCITGINPIASSTPLIELYPNPTNGILRITNDGELRITNMEIYNVMGEKVYSAIINSQSSIINVKQPAGVYFLRLKTERETLTQKFIIQE